MGCAGVVQKGLSYEETHLLDRQSQSGCCGLPFWYRRYPSLLLLTFGLLATGALCLRRWAGRYDKFLGRATLPPLIEYVRSASWNWNLVKVFRISRLFDREDKSPFKALQTLSDEGAPEIRRIEVEERSRSIMTRSSEEWLNILNKVWKETRTA